MIQNNIKNYFNEQNFYIIKGTDNKKYLGIVTSIMGDPEKLQGNLVIYTTYQDFFNPKNYKKYTYENMFNLNYGDFDSQIRLKINDNKIYYYYVDCNESYAEERLYTINNKLEYKVIDKFEVSGAGAC